MSTTRVLIVGAAGWNNAGDDLIALRISDWARRSRKVRFLGGEDIPHSSREQVVGSTLGRLKAAKEILLANVVIIGGGGLLDDRYPTFFAHSRESPGSLE